MRPPRGFQPKAALAEVADVDDSGKQQTVTHHGFAGEKHSGVYRVQWHGFSSRPPKGATGIVLSLGGARSRSVLLGGEHDDKRPKDLKEGESVFYGADSSRLHFSKDGVNIDAGDDKKPVRVIVGNMKITAENGKATIEVGSMKIIATPDRIDLGGTGGNPVVTTAGPSTKVFSI